MKFDDIKVGEAYAVGAYAERGVVEEKDRRKVVRVYSGARRRTMTARRRHSCPTCACEPAERKPVRTCQVCAQGGKDLTTYLTWAAVFLIEDVGVSSDDLLIVAGKVTG